MMIKSGFLVFLSLALLTGGCRHRGDESAPAKNPANKANRVSPPATASATTGGNHVTVNYSSPRVKNRVIWGGLVPYGKVWRTGANEATTIQFTKDVLVEGQPLKKDTYGLFTIPDTSEWTIIFNLDETQWGAFKYNPTKDALRVKVKPVPVDSFQENMTFYVLPDTQNNGGTVRLWWEKLVVDFHFRNAPQE